MSQLSTIAGAVSGLRMDTDISVNTTTTVSHEANPGVSTSTQTIMTKSMVFRIDNRPANMNCAINLSNGDQVTAAGLMKGEFEVLALKNHTTRTMYWVPGPNMVAPVIYMIVGVFMIGFYGIGWLLIGGGAWFLYDANQKKSQLDQAKSIVEKANVPNGTK